MSVPTLTLAICMKRAGLLEHELRSQPATRMPNLWGSKMHMVGQDAVVESIEEAITTPATKGRGILQAKAPPGAARSNAGGKSLAAYSKRMTALGN